MYLIGSMRVALVDSETNLSYIQWFEGIQYLNLKTKIIEINQLTTRHNLVSFWLRMTAGEPGGGRCDSECCGMIKHHSGRSLTCGSLSGLQICEKSFMTACGKNQKSTKLLRNGLTLGIW